MRNVITFHRLFLSFGVNVITLGMPEVITLSGFYCIIKTYAEQKQTVITQGLNYKDRQVINYEAEDDTSISLTLTNHVKDVDR